MTERNEYPPILDEIEEARRRDVFGRIAGARKASDGTTIITMTDDFIEVFEDAEDVAEIYGASMFMRPAEVFAYDARTIRVRYVEQPSAARTAFIEGEVGR